MSLWSPSSSSSAHDLKTIESSLVDDLKSITLEIDYLCFPSIDEHSAMLNVTNHDRYRTNAIVYSLEFGTIYSVLFLEEQTNVSSMRTGVCRHSLMIVEIIRFQFDIHRCTDLGIDAFSLLFTFDGHI